MRKESGFTLVEIIVVIVLIGILSAVALPRFFDFTSEAEEATVDGTAGALSSGLSMAQTKWLMQNQPNSITVDNTGIMMSTRGYPVGVVGVDAGNVLSEQGCALIARKMLSNNSVNIGTTQNANVINNYKFVAVPYDQIQSRVEG